MPRVTAQISGRGVWDVVAVTSGLAAVREAEPHIRQRFTDLLNAYHRRSEDFAYWDLIGGEWLLHFSHVVYAAYRDALHAPIGGQIEHPIPVFADHPEFMEAAVGDPRLATTLRAHVEAVLFRPAACRWAYLGDTKVIGKGSGGFRAAAKRAVFSGLSSSSAPFVFCNPYIINGRGEWLSALWKWRRWARQDDFDYPVCTEAPIDSAWRRRAAEVSGTSYGDAVLALMPLYLPVAYLEGYAAYRRQALALGLPRPRVLYTANSLYGHTLFKVLAADWRMEGTSILNHQHGGGYGIDCLHVVEEYETRVADRFYTFGWSSSPKQVPLAGSSLRLAYRGTKQPRRILLVCVNFPDSVYRLHFQPMPGCIETMVSQVTDFVAGIGDGMELVVRPYRYDYGRNFVARLRQTGAAFTLDDPEAGSTDSYARSGLVVHSYLGTSWLETLAMNIPTVCFYSADTYAFRASARPFIDRLVAVGILHTSAATAASHVRATASDPQAWWHGSDVQSAREAFVENYANFSTTWANSWEQEFRTWIE